MAGKYLTLQDRKTIAKMYREEARVLDIAIKIGCHPATIYEELRRGDTGKLDERQRPEYDPSWPRAECRRLSAAGETGGTLLP